MAWQNNKQKKYQFLIWTFLIVVIAVTLSLVGFYFSKKNNYHDYEVVNLEIAGEEVLAEAVYSNAAKYQGLSHRGSLAENKGMLFIYNEAKNLAFVMRNMNFSLDIAFIEDGVIKKIFSNLEPEDEKNLTIYSYKSADMVLEMSAGYFNSKNIVEGDSVIIKN